MTRSPFGVFVGIFLLGVGLLGGIILGKAGWAKERPLPGESRPALSLRCIQFVEFDARNTPVLTERTWTRAEAEGRYQAAKAYLETAESAGLWADRGRRAVQLATAMMLEVLVCSGQAGGGLR